MIFLEKEFVGIRGPSSMVSPRKRLRAIIHFAAKRGLHREEAVFDLPVVMDEILDPKLDAVSGSENDSDPLRNPMPRRGSKHFRVTAKLNGIIRLWRPSQFGIPNFVLSRV